MMNSFYRRILLLAALSVFLTSLGDSQATRKARHASAPPSRGILPSLSQAQRVARAGLDAVSLPWTDDVEKGPGSWTADGFWHVIYRPQKLHILSPTIWPRLVLLPDSGYLPVPYSGDYAWWYGEDSTGTFIGNDFDPLQDSLSGGTSVAPNFGSLVTPPINLNGQKLATLTFETWWEVEGVATQSFDLMYVEISSDGGEVWASLGRGLLNPLNTTDGAEWEPYSSGGLGNKGVWTQQIFNLTPYVGDTVMVRFSFDTGDREFNGFRGWFIDNISVTGTGQPAPIISSVRPSTAKYGAIVKINGSNFVSGAQLMVDSALVEGAAVMSSTEFTFPANLGLGKHSITVSNPDGNSVTAPGIFTISEDAGPTIDSITPGSAVAGKSVPFVVRGANLQKGVTVAFDSVTASTAWVDSTTVSGNTPPTLPTGIYNVLVTNPDGLTDQLILAFRVLPGNLPPALSSIQPDSVEVGVSTVFTLTGSQFEPGAAVDFGANPALGVGFSDPTIVYGTTPPGLPIGTYDVRLTNRGGLAGTLSQAFRVVQSAIRVIPQSIPEVGKPLSLVVTPPTGTTYQSAVLHFRRGGTNAFDSLALSSSGAGYQGGLPDTLMTIRGVQYWVALRNANGILSTYPSINPQSYPGVFSVRVGALPSAAQTAAMEYHMISTPVALDQPQIGAQLSADLGSYDPSKWRVFRWEGNDNVEFPAIQAPLAPGNGFWLITDAGEQFSFRGGSSFLTPSAYAMTLDTGWTQIASPFGFPQIWLGVIQYGGHVSGPYSFDGTEYRLDSLLFPFEGYFVHNDEVQQVQLGFLPVDIANTTLGKKNAAPAELTPGEIVVQLSAQMRGTKYRDSYNYLGIRNAASVGRDDFDAPKPPPIGNGVRLNIMDKGRSYLRNFKPAGDGGESWIVTLKGAGVKGDVDVAVATSGTLPPGYSLYVFDLDNECVVPVLGGTFAVNLANVGASRSFKVVMGTDAYVKAESGGTSLEPVSFALEQNYPNPFNPSTNIRYSLAKRSTVVLELYNAIGQKVRTLIDGEQSTGTYGVVWNGKNDAGGHVASGVYFYRLRTDSFTAVRKLLLLR
jgi:hypothetical protein